MDLVSINEELLSIKKHLNYIKKKYNLLLTGELEVSSLAEIKIGCILDEFTYISFCRQGQLLQLTPENWLQEISSFQPHILFVESAWQGIDMKWFRKVNYVSQELADIVEWCKMHKIPTVFWNKEDPAHFDTFINTAHLFDYVFTTDIDCIEKYKTRLQHENVFLLPFAAETQFHHPVETFERQKAFCFAGAYYHRYEERQRDFETIFGVVPSFGELVIYDRNFGKNVEEQYCFPEKYKPYILGNLKTEEIERAYKGYVFGLNLNSIKQSQTMFARRVFELLASNTVVISNYSRGIKTLLGELTVCTDDAGMLGKMLARFEDPVYLRKYRLLGLRKVLSEHTYYERLRYIIKKIYKKDYLFPEPKITVVSRLKTTAQFHTVYNCYRQQRYLQKKLVVLADGKLDLSSTELTEQGITILKPKEIKGKTLKDMFQEGFVAYFSPGDYYGPFYLFDLALSRRFARAAAVGKRTYYRCDKSTPGEVALVNPGNQYRYVDGLDVRSCIFSVEEYAGEGCDLFFSEPENMVLTCEGRFLSIDEFNYCRDGAEMPEHRLVDDLELEDQGVELAGLQEKAEAVTANTSAAEQDLTVIKAPDIYPLMEKSASGLVKQDLDGNELTFSSYLTRERHEYVYNSQPIRLDGIRAGEKLPVFFNAQGNLDLQLTMNFLTEERKKISPAFCLMQSYKELDIPAQSYWVKLGFRVKGQGRARVKSIEFGRQARAPLSFIARSDTLVVSNVYPSYQDLYRNAFVHARVMRYKDLGKRVDVFAFSPGMGPRYREFEGIDVAEGDYEALREALARNDYKNICVHFLDARVWDVLQDLPGRPRVLVWVHGAEIQPWHRRSYNYRSEEELAKAKKSSDERIAFWHKLFAAPPSNLHFVFVSRHFAESVFEDVGVRLPEESFSVIHNYINTDLFGYVPKPPGQRLKILSIRPYHSYKYANDLSVRAILELAQRPFFEELEFLLIGDGPLFEETTEPLKPLKNVTLQKRFLRQEEIAAIHKEYGIFLVPTRMDSQGVSRDEAMSSGLVPVTNNVAAIPEFVDGTCGMLTGPEDFQGLADAIAELYLKPDLFAGLSASAAKRVRSQCGLENTIQKELDLLNGEGPK